LAWHLGYPLLERWIVLSILLYLITGAFWLPVVWMQTRMRDLALASACAGEPLPPAYHRLFRVWFAFGFPAFASVLAIFWLMIAKPALGCGDRVAMFALAGAGRGKPISADPRCALKQGFPKTARRAEPARQRGAHPLRQSHETATGPPAPKIGLFVACGVPSRARVP